MQVERRTRWWIFRARDVRTSYDNDGICGRSAPWDINGIVVPVNGASKTTRSTPGSSSAQIANVGSPTSWFLRLWTGAGHQQPNVLLPIPFLDDDQSLLPEADWSRLDAWDDRRARHLDAGPDPLDRAGRGFRHQ